MTTEDQDSIEIRQLAAIVGRRQIHPRKTPAIGPTINELLQRRGYANVQQHADLGDVWRTVAPGHLSRQSRVYRLSRSVLEIAVDNSAALQDLTFQKKKMLTRLQEVLGPTTVKDIRFKVTP